MTDRLTQLEAILAIDPHDAFVLYGIAQEHAKAGDLDRAIEFYDRTIAADPDYCYAYYHQAKAHEAAGRDAAARAALTAGLVRARGCGDDQAIGEIGVYLDELGDA